MASVAQNNIFRSIQPSR